MKKIGITGQKGFTGSYLYNTISLLKDEFELIPFEKSFFENEHQLQEWVKQCDTIVHLAAMNRHPDPQVIYDTNIDLVNKLISALEKTGSTAQIIFSSSTQEERDNLYGRSKSEGRKRLAAWAEKHNGKLTGLIIPNVFGPFGKPFYNSFIATFCHQLCYKEIPHIETDATVKLIHIDELAKVIIQSIRAGMHNPAYRVEHTSAFTVSKILEQLNHFKTLYLEGGILPQLPDKFSIDLFNTFRSYINVKNYFPFKLKQNTDNRGTFVELVKLHQGGQISFSTTHPGITRGNHFHTRKIERFAVIKGKALIQLRKYNNSEVFNFELDGEQPAYVDMPVWYTHNIKNTGDDDLYTVFWINEFFDASDPDTYFETV
ncbi:MAG TPA: NAD-dependent epimerase/dehydratase family protein [Agriterribacter sp.]|nr:NAD-dependent epimerase/dehydratase family protein [Agriterribacter sp.]